MSRIWNLSLVLALALGSGCKKKSDEVTPSSANPADAGAAKRKTPREQAVEQVLALDAVVKKYTKLVADADAAGDFDKATELRTRLGVAQKAYADAKTRLEMMDTVSPMLQQREREQQGEHRGEQPSTP